MVTRFRCTRKSARLANVWGAAKLGKRLARGDGGERSCTMTGERMDDGLLRVCVSGMTGCLGNCLADWLRVCVSVRVGEEGKGDGNGGMEVGGVCRGGRRRERVSTPTESAHTHTTTHTQTAIHTHALCLVCVRARRWDARRAARDTHAQSRGHRPRRCWRERLPRGWICRSLVRSRRHFFTKVPSPPSLTRGLSLRVGFGLCSCRFYRGAPFLLEHPSGLHTPACTPP